MFVLQGQCKRFGEELSLLLVPEFTLCSKRLNLVRHVKFNVYHEYLERHVKFNVICMYVCMYVCVYIYIYIYSVSRTS